MATFVQAPTPVITAAVTTLNIVYASNVTAGNLLLVFARSASITTTSISDNLAGSGSWRAASGPFGTADKMVWYKLCEASGAMTVTVTGASGTIRLAAYEFSGTATFTGGLLNVVRAPASATDISLSGSANTSALVVAGAAGAEASDTVTAGASAPNSNLSTVTNASGWIALENSASWTGGTATPHFTLSAGVNGADMFVIGFEPTSPSPATSPAGHVGPF